MSSAKNPRVEAAIQEGSRHLDSFIEAFSSLLLNNIKNLISCKDIEIEFCDDVIVKIDDIEMESEAFEVYENGYFIIKEFHEDIKNYLEENFEGLQWKVDFSRKDCVKVHLVYQVDYKAIKKNSVLNNKTE